MGAGVSEAEGNEWQTDATGSEAIGGTGTTSAESTLENESFTALMLTRQRSSPRSAAKHLPQPALHGLLIRLPCALEPGFDLAPLHSCDVAGDLTVTIIRVAGPGAFSVNPQFLNWAIARTAAS